jgi:hypothetical protein
MTTDNDDGSFIQQILRYMITSSRSLRRAGSSAET